MGGNGQPRPVAAAWDEVLELGIDLADLASLTGGKRPVSLAFHLELKENGNVVERLPSSGVIRLEVPREDHQLDNWYV